jgi:hypothetical protein
LLVVDLHLNLLIGFRFLWFGEEALVVLASPEEILDEVREGQIYNTFEQIIDQLLPLRSVCAASELQTLDYRLNFFL